MVSFSIIVPAYNSAATIESTLRSVVDQVLPPHEVIVVDDGSTDDTAEVARGVGGPVRVVAQPNGGTASARNRGIHEATGDVIGFLDADDLYTPDRLARIAARYERQPELDAVATDTLLSSPERTFRVGSHWPGGPTTHVDIRTPIIFCALTIRREVLAELGDFDSRFRDLEDAEMFYRLLCRRYVIGFVNEPSYIYRLQEQSKTSSGSVRNYREHAAVQFRYAFARGTPLAFRPRLIVRGLRHLRSLLRVALVSRRSAG
jgi:glycosyltransferase involved in cell wall biosynthesis